MVDIELTLYFRREVRIHQILGDISEDIVRLGLHHSLCNYTDVPKSLTRDQLQSRKDKAVRFVRDVLADPDRADEIDGESLESYAERRKIQLANKGIRRIHYMATRQELQDQIADLQEENQQLQDQLDAIADIVSPDDDANGDDDDSDADDDENGDDDDNGGDDQD